MKSEDFKKLAEPLEAERREVEKTPEEVPATVASEKTGDEINAEQAAEARAAGKEYQGREPGDKKLKVIEKKNGE